MDTEKSELNKLLFKLKNISQDLVEAKEAASFRCDKLKELQKPWVVKKDERKSSATSQEVDAKSSSVSATSTSDQQVLKEMEKVDNLLKQARQIRQGQEQKPKQCKVNKASIRSSKQSSKPLSAPVKHHKSRSAALSSVKKKPPSEENLHSIKQDSDVAAYETKSEAKGAVIDEDKYLGIPEIVKTYTLPSKYVKLRNLHKKLAASVAQVDRDKTPCESKEEFMSKLYNIPESDTSCEKYAFETRGFTPVTFHESISRAVSTCRTLTAFLKHKVSQPVSVTPSNLYYQKLIYSRATEMSNDLENQLKLFQNARIHGQETHHKSSHGLLNWADMCKLSTQYLTYESTSELRRHANLVQQLNWSHLNLTLKKEMHSVLMDILRLQERTLEAEKSLTNDTVVSLTTAYGLLANENLCCGNPAIVLCDS